MAEPAGAPLTGRMIVVTRSREQASALSDRLRDLGARVIEIPAIAIAPPASYEPLDAALRELHNYDWLIVTSANTARILNERAQRIGWRPTIQPRTVAVGTATASALEQAGWRVDLVPQPAVAESIVAALAGRVHGQRVLLARAEVARDLIPVALETVGAQVTIVVAYRTVIEEASVGLVASTFAPAGSEQPVSVDGLTFTSSSTVRNLFTLLRSAGIEWPAGAKVFSIGPITSATLREHGIEPDAEAAQHDVDGLVAAVLHGLG